MLAASPAGGGQPVGEPGEPRTPMIEALAPGAFELGSLVAAVGVLVVNAKVDRFIGRVEALETAHHAHVNTPGLHGVR